MRGDVLGRKRRGFGYMEIKQRKRDGIFVKGGAIGNKRKLIGENGRVVVSVSFFLLSLSKVVDWWVAFGTIKSTDFQR